jgi:hypothetical protein
MPSGIIIVMSTKYCDVNTSSTEKDTKKQQKAAKTQKFHTTSIMPLFHKLITDETILKIKQFLCLKE